MEHAWRRRAHPLLLAALIAGTLSAGRAAETQKPFTAVRVDRTTDAPRESREQALKELARQHPSPQHIVVLIHGFDTSLSQSDEQYTQVAADIRSEFQKRGESVAILGVQWDSDVGALRSWLPKAIASHLAKVVGKKGPEDPYKSRVLMARSVGRKGARQILLDVQERFPDAHIHAFVHSLGSEVILNALNPDATVPAGEDSPDSYLPEKRIRLDVAALAGADLDQDVALNGSGWTPERLPRLFWVTIPEIGAGKDKVLILRKVTRGKAAIGNSFPRLRADQLDGLIGGRLLVFDTNAIPGGHELVKYYGPKRIADLAETAAALRDPARTPSPLFKELETVLAAPEQLEMLRPHLASQETSARVYTLWRLERMLCGNSIHLEDGYLMKVAALAKNPKQLERERQVTTCRLVRAGLWPPQRREASGEGTKMEKPKKPTQPEKATKPGQGDNPEKPAQPDKAEKTQKPEAAGVAPAEPQR
jgi:hypothetical protein